MVMSTYQEPNKRTTNFVLVLLLTLVCGQMKKSVKFKNVRLILAFMVDTLTVLLGTG
jgi:hypothetical protein